MAHQCDRCDVSERWNTYVLSRSQLNRHSTEIRRSLNWPQNTTTACFRDCLTQEVDTAAMLLMGIEPPTFVQ